MGKPFFNKNIIPKCAYCKFGKTSDYSGEVFCLKHGVTDAQNVCGKYEYDVLKRTPQTPALQKGFCEEDFKL